MTKICIKCYNMEKHKRYKIQYGYKKNRRGFCDECGKYSKYLVFTKAPWTRRRIFFEAITDFFFAPRLFLSRLVRGYYKERKFF